jgi:hypothetical protein
MANKAVTKTSFGTGHNFYDNTRIQIMTTTINRENINRDKCNKKLKEPIIITTDSENCNLENRTKQQITSMTEAKELSNDL